MSSPLVMGVVNVTPDLFSDGGEFLDAARAVEHAAELVREGADVLDIGGESTRPGADAVGAEEERRRVIPVLDGLVGVGVPISIDTSKAAVAEAALDAGATWVNDVSALRADPDLAALCADRGCEVVLMHMLGDPRTMQDDPRYDDVVDDVRGFLPSGSRPRSRRASPRSGSGSTRNRLRQDDRPQPGVAPPPGRAARTGPPDSGRRLAQDLHRQDHRPRRRRAGGGTIATTAIAATEAAAAIRVHDVAATRDALLTVDAIAG